MKKTMLIRILIISTMFIICSTVSNAAETTIRMQVVNGGALWNNITVSESYEECEKLNSSTSTLGTSSLKAHLTTDADWSIMAIFSVSQYGGTNSNQPNQTTGNKSGIYNLGNYVQTTGILETATSKSTSYISGLFDGDNVKPYVKKWSTDAESTSFRGNFVGFKETWGWYNSETSFFGKSSGYPVSIKSGLFGGRFGNDNTYAFAAGKGSSLATFRPVIWN